MWLFALVEGPVLKIERIFLDMDGVIADFVGAVGRMRGIDDVEDIWSPLGSYDVSDQVGFGSEALMWREIESRGTDFWIDIEPYPWTQELIASCRAIAPTIILTSPARDPASSSGKVKWLLGNLGQDFRDYILCPHHRKALLARPGRILIDDSDANVEGWTRAGGEAILFPRKWNSNHAGAADPMAYVMLRLATLKVPDGFRNTPIPVEGSPR